MKVLNFLVFQIKDIAIFADFLCVPRKDLYVMTSFQITRGKFVVRRGNTGNLTIQFEWGA